MLAIARELNNADTAFILAPDGADHDVRARFFTPRTEVGFVGHATVAAHYVLSRAGRRRDGATEVQGRDRRDRDPGRRCDRRIAVRQSSPPLGREFNDRERLAVLDCTGAGLGRARRTLSFAHRRREQYPAHGRGAGAEKLRQLKPDFARLTTLSAQLGAAGYFVFTLAPQVRDCLTESRMFCPALGISEDPVSGNAHGLLGAYLAHLPSCGATASARRFAERRDTT